MKSIKNTNQKIIVIFIISIFLVLGIVLLIIFLINNNYIKSINFYLNGDEVVTIEEGTSFNDPLFVASYNGESLISDVLIDSDLDINKPNIYKITYTIKKGLSSKTLTRTIIVKKRNEQLTLNLKGDNLVYVCQGCLYNEPGYIALSYGVDISDEVITKGNVDTDKIGEYVIEYHIEQKPYSRQKTRNVKVVPFDYQIELLNNSEYVYENNISFSSKDDNYDYILLPSGEKNFKQEINYPIADNGNYKFVIYNKLGFSVEKEFAISNIDRDLPLGTCNGYMYDNYTELNVSASDASGIDSYEYLYGDKNSGKISDSKFTYTDLINTAKVNIYDKANNAVSLKCEMTDKSTITPSSYKSYTFVEPSTSRKLNYWLYIPDNLTKRSSVPLLIYLHGDGSKGTNVNLVNDYAYPNFIKQGEKFPFMMIAGQVSTDSNWTDESVYKRLLNLVNTIVSTYNVNPKKIMLAGGSSGANGALSMTISYSNYFSCTVIGAGVSTYAYSGSANKLINTPIWFFHGTEDKNYESVKALSEKIKSFGGKVIFKGIERAGHSVTETTDGFKNPELINWMISQERN